MKGREHYERLISDSLDRPLSEREARELERALRELPELARFRARLMEQAARVRSLPRGKTDRPLSLPAATPARRRLVPSLWHRRISVPVPLAAGVALAFLVSLPWGPLARRARPPAPEAEPVRAEFVQIERLEPVAATRVPQDRRQGPAVREAP